MRFFILFFDIDFHKLFLFDSLQTVDILPVI